MYPDIPWNPWPQGPSPPPLPEPKTWADPMDAVHDYALRLNQVIARAREDAPKAALDQLEQVQVPANGGLEAIAMLDRKRLELLEHLKQVRQEVCLLPEISLDAWLDFFFTSADMAASPSVHVDWLDPPEGFAIAEQVPVEEGARFRARVRQSGAERVQLRELNHHSPSYRGQAALDAQTQCLTLCGHPFYFEQAKRALDRLSARAPLACTFSYDRTRDVQEGMLLSVRLTLRNLSTDYLVLDALSTDHACDAVETFSRPSLGQLSYEQGLDCFTYQAMAQGVTTTVFHTACLRPGEERMVAINLKMLSEGDSWREFHLRYRRFDEATFGQVAFVATPGPTDQFPPSVVYARLCELPEADKADLATVLLHPPEAGEPETICWAMPFHIGRRAFPLSQARKRLSEPAEPVHFSRWQQAWVMRTADGCALVTQSRVTRYPRVDAECFVLIDEAEQRVPVRFADELVPTYMALPLGISDWESHRMGLSVSLPKLKLTAFFQEVERLGCAIAVVQNMLGRQSLQVSP
ncbi:MAG TPA: hypothetical protein V6D47_16340 [Oscillatoriaceae cyanobacterium]